MPANDHLDVELLDRDFVEQPVAALVDVALFSDLLELLHQELGKIVFLFPQPCALVGDVAVLLGQIFEFGDPINALGAGDLLAVLVDCASSLPSHVPQGSGE
jgi:hypothetical protein